MRLDNKKYELNRHPSWLKIRLPVGEKFDETLKTILGNNLNTVCKEACCPNMGECFSHRTATFLILGDTCTRRCSFCSVKKGKPQNPDPMEPLNIANAVHELGMCYVVLTSVDRDDLPDKGASHFVETVETINRRVKSCKVEVLTPDFKGNEELVSKVAKSSITVFGHNVETVPSLYKRVRPGANFERSLSVLISAKRANKNIQTKTGLMVGLGENENELEETIRIIGKLGVDILTIGQYLRPTLKQLPVQMYVHPGIFNDLKCMALSCGFKHVESGPLVRSSYHAWKYMQ